MRKLFILITMFLPVLFATGQQELFVPTAASRGLNGPVRVVQTVKYYDWEQDAYPYTSSEAYSKDGFLMYNTYVSYIGTEELTFYQKDEQNRLTDILFSGNLYGDHYIYSDDGRLQYIVTDHPDERISKDTLFVTAYDAHGRTLELSKEGKPKYRYSYRADGSLFSAENINSWTIYYNPQGQEDSIRTYYDFTEYRYNENGDLIMEIKHYKDTGEPTIGDAGDTTIRQYHYNEERDRYGNWLSIDIEKDDLKHHIVRHIIYYEQ